MTKLKIGFFEEDHSWDDLRAFPKEPCSPFYYCTYAEISIYFSNSLLIPPKIKEKGLKYSTTGYLFSLFLSLLESRSVNQRLISMGMSYGGPDLYVKRLDDKIYLFFGAAPPKEYAKVELPFKDFLEEILRSSGVFIDKLFEMNPALAKHPDVIKLVNERNKTIKFFEEL